MLHIASSSSELEHLRLDVGPVLIPEPRRRSSLGSGTILELRHAKATPSGMIRRLASLTTSLGRF